MLAFYSWVIFIGLVRTNPLENSLKTRDSMRTGTLQVVPCTGSKQNLFSELPVQTTCLQICTYFQLKLPVQVPVQVPV